MMWVFFQCNHQLFLHISPIYCIVFILASVQFPFITGARFERSYIAQFVAAQNALKVTFFVLVEIISNITYLITLCLPFSLTNRSR